VPGADTKSFYGTRKKNAVWKAKQSGYLRDSKLRGFDFTGGILHSRMCYKTEFWHPLPITAHTNDRIDFLATSQKLWKGPDDCKKGYARDAPEKFYIEALDALNRPGEWWYDRKTQRLYVYLNGGASPAGQDLKGKVSNMALDFQRSANVHVLGLDFFGAFASAGSGGGGAMESNTFTFPNYPQFILGQQNPAQNQMQLPNQRFVDNDVRFFAVGAHVTGPLVHVENNLFEHGIYGCGPMGCGVIFVSSAKGSPLVTRNTIRFTQQWHGIVWLVPGFEGSYNHLHDLASVRDDASIFQTKFIGEKKSHIHHNWAYNSELKGVRYDTCGNRESTPDGRPGKDGKGHPDCGGAVWNNVFFNCHQGANIKGDYQLIVANTAFSNAVRSDITVSPKGVGGTEDGFIYNYYSHTYNNAADLLSPHDRRCVRPLRGKSESNYVAKCAPEGSKQLADRVSTTLLGVLRDPLNFDFRPRADLSYPKGLVKGATSKVPDFETLDGKKLKLQGGPDLGAYQHSDEVYWMPGKMFNVASTPVPPHTSTTARADVDLMFLGSKAASYYDVHLSSSPCDLKKIATLRAPRNIVPRSSLGALPVGTWLYWRVDVVSEAGRVLPGPVWCFAVGPQGGGCAKAPCGDWSKLPGTPCMTDSGHAAPAELSCSSTTTTATTTTTRVITTTTTTTTTTTITTTITTSRMTTTTTSAPLENRRRRRRVGRRRRRGSSKRRRRRRSTRRRRNQRRRSKALSFAAA